MMIHYSDASNIDLYDIEAHSQRTNGLPCGLWLSYGNWYSFDGKYRKYKYIFEFNRTHKILSIDISSIDSILSSIDDYPSQMIHNIDWTKVQKDYDGVMFENVEGAYYPQFNTNTGFWINSLCVSSLCLFSPTRCGIITRIIPYNLRNLHRKN